MIAAHTTLWRIHHQGGAHPTGWDQLRHYGPTPSRFDHHPPPPRLHTDHGIVYLTVGARAFVTAIAERFQDADGGGIGPIERRADVPALTAFDAATDLQVLDLTSGWTTRAGGNQAICSGPRPACQAWARAIHHAHGHHVHGLSWTSSVYGEGHCIAIWASADRVFPAEPRFSRDLADARLDTPLAVAAQTLGTYTIA